MTDQTINFISIIPTYRPYQRENLDLNAKLKSTLDSGRGRIFQRRFSKTTSNVEDLNIFAYAIATLPVQRFSSGPQRQIFLDKFRKIQRNHSKKVAKKIEKELSQDEELKSSLKVIRNLSKLLNMNNEHYGIIKGIPAEIRSQVEEIYKNTNVTIWGHEVVKENNLIIGSLAYSLENPSSQLTNIADELVLLQMSSLHLPKLLEYSEILFKHLQVFIDDLHSTSAKEFVLPNQAIKDQLMEYASIIVGKTLGIRDSLNSARKQVKRYRELPNDLHEEAGKLKINIDKILEEKLNPKSLDDLDLLLIRLEEVISANVENLRNFNKEIGNSQIGAPSSNISDLLNKMNLLYISFEKFRFLADIYVDIASFSPMSSDALVEADIDEPLENVVVFASDLTKTYQLYTHTVYAIRGIDLLIKRGEFVVIMGPSGSGKTTLLNLMAGLDKPERGILKVFGIDMRRAKKGDLQYFRRNIISFIYQNYNLIPLLQSYENVRLPADFGTANKIGSKKKRALQLLENVELSKFSKTEPNKLSGGQQQRVSIARSLMNEPELIFADEPTGDLDHKTGAKIMELLKMAHERGKTIILVTHDAEVAKYGTRIIKMLDGKILEDSSQ